MAFNQLPGIGKNILKPAITPYPQFQPQMEMEQTGRAAKVISNANASTNASTRSSGRRTGGKSGVRNKYKDLGVPVTVAPNRRGGNNNSYPLKLTTGDFSQNIDGTNSPVNFNDRRDTTIFRDFNQRSRYFGETDEVLQNDVTNSLKLLEINLNDSFIYPDSFGEGWDVIRNAMTRDIIGNTKSAKGALDILDDVQDYFSTVCDAFDLLIELEVMQAWSPSEKESYNRSYRAIAEFTSVPEILNYRSRLRQALIPHVLPFEWMEYIKWIRETKLESPVKQSGKLRFISSAGAHLIDDLYRGNTPTDWQTRITDAVIALNNLKAQIPAILLYNVESVDLRNVKDCYTGVHNSAAFDADWNDIFNNRVHTWVKAGGQTAQYPSISSTSKVYASFSTDTPILMALGALNRQHLGYGLPLEGPVTTAQLGSQGLANSVFQITETFNSSTGSTHTIRGLEKWYEFSDSSTHVIDIDGAGNLNKAISTPKGYDTIAFVADKSNMDQAARESFTAMTLKGYN